MRTAPLKVSRQVRVTLSPTLAESLKLSGKSLVVYATLKFSCMIAKYFRAELSDNVPETAVPIEAEGITVYVVFKAIGTKFCGGDIGFQDFDFPLKEPERFFPKWIKVNEDLSGEFGYA